MTQGATEFPPGPDPVGTVSHQLTSLVRSVDSWELTDLRPESLHHAKQVIADTVGVILAGGSSPAFIRLATEAMPGWDESSGFGAQLATLGGGRADPQRAAFVNACIGTIPELDELLKTGGGGGHPAVHIVPAALAVAQDRGSSGAELLLAIVKGYEVAAHLFRAFDLHPEVQPHGHLASVGGAVAVATLLGKDPVEAAWIAASMPLVSLWQTTLEGATVHYAYTGISALIAILANQLAASGLTGSRESLELCFGQFLGTTSIVSPLPEAADPQAPVMDQNITKSYSCCGRAYPAIGAALRLPDIDVDGIEGITVQVDETMLKISGVIPSNELQTRFSIEYAVATCLANGHADPSAFRLDPRVLELARLVTVEPFPGSNDQLAPGSKRARLTVHLAGRRLTTEGDGTLGRLRFPLPDQVMRARFSRCVQHPDTGLARAHYDQLMALETLDHVRHIIVA